MSIPDHNIVVEQDGHAVVMVGGEIAGSVSPDAEYPGLWAIRDATGRMMGRHLDREAGAAFLAEWFVAHDEGDQ